MKFEDCLQDVTNQLYAASANEKAKQLVVLHVTYIYSALIVYYHSSASGLFTSTLNSRVIESRKVGHMFYGEILYFKKLIFCISVCIKF